MHPRPVIGGQSDQLEKDWRPLGFPERLLASGGLQPEPVSPELVLVDPDLARRERARLEEKARLASYLDVEALRRVVEREAGARDDEAQLAPGRDLRGFARQRLLPALFLASLFANGVLASELVLRGDDAEAIRAVPAAARSLDVPTTATRDVATIATHDVATTATDDGQPPLLRGRAVVERRLISLILKAPARKLPPAFLDPSTGLLRNNVQVTCRRAKSRSYLCAVQMPNVDPTGGILVRYRDGRATKGVFTWYGYKPHIGTARFLQNRRQTRAVKTK